MRVLFRRDIECQQFVELITDYLEGALPRGLVKAVDRHIAACPDCTEYLAQMRRTIQITGHIDGQIKGEPPPQPLPDEMLDALQKAFEEFHNSAGA
ncbi:MAG: anti-sigma factor [Acidimicrobiales bacterium]|nr:anti-sigma factor [Acidimicrobiales bacterium]